MNRQQRRAARMLPAEREARVTVRAFDNAYHWGEIKRIKSEYDGMGADEQVRRKPALAAEIDGHLAQLIAQ